MPKKKKHWVGVLLGESCHGKEEEEFDTPEEVEAYMKGVSTAVGWMDVAEWFLPSQDPNAQKDFNNLVRNEELGIYEHPEEPNE